MKNITRIAMKASLLSMIMTLGCAKPSTDTHSIALQFGSYATAKNNILRLLLPEARASVSNLKLCFKRLRFKMAGEVTNADPTVDSDNIDFNLGEIDVSAGSTALGTVQLPDGNYKRIEFDLENSCASGKSIQLSNSSGSYSSVERITIKFEGDFTANADGTLNLGVQQILDQLNNYNGAGDLKVTAEAISGVLSN